MDRVVQNDLHPIGPREIDQPPPLQDIASRNRGPEFGSGFGLLFPLELGFGLPQRQHKHREFTS